MSDDDALVHALSQRLRITKVVASRSVKGRAGDHFAAFASRYNSVQEEPAGHVKDLLASDGDEAIQGMTLVEARIAHYLVAMLADVAAHEAAWAGGGITEVECSDQVGVIRASYGKLIRAALRQ